MEKKRFYDLDAARAFMILLVLLDHAMHAYSPLFSWLWFVPGISQHVFLDVWHIHNDAIMMPFLFLLSGLFVWPALHHKGAWYYLKSRLPRLAVPFIMGVLFLVPILIYLKKLIRQDYQNTFWHFLWHEYMAYDVWPFENVSQGGFWFLMILMGLTVFTALVHALLPRFWEKWGRLVACIIKKPWIALIGTCILASLILFLSDLRWGGHFWIVFKPFFHVRGARFILEISSFFVGLGLSAAGFLEKDVYLNALARHWKRWLMASVLLGAVYIFYVLAYYHQGAYADDVMRYFWQLSRHGESFFVSGRLKEISALIADVGPAIFIRTSLLGCFIVLLSVTYLALFRRFCSEKTLFWSSLAMCSYGIYIIHEPFVLGCHVLMYGYAFSALLKFFITASVSLGLSWLIVAKILFKVPYIRRFI